MSDITEITMAYDALGRRCRKSVNGERTFFTWDGDALLSERFEDQPAREYVYYPDTFEPLAAIDGDGQVYYYHNDPNGLPRELTRPNGEIVWSASYDHLGRVAQIAVNEVAQPLRLQGQYHDPELGLCYNRHRYFDPRICAFISQDPLGLAAGTNLYTYAPNVWGWVDPLGLCKEATLIREPNFFVSQSGQAIASCGYRAIGGKSNIAEALEGTISSRNPTYITFDDITKMPSSEVKEILQLPRTPSHAVEFNTRQLLDDLSIPKGRWNTKHVPETLTNTFPEWGAGGGTQAITNKSIRIDRIVKLK